MKIRVKKMTEETKEESPVKDQADTGTSTSDLEVKPAEPTSDTRPSD